MLINLEKKPEIIAKNVARCREKGITLPTFAQMKNPDLIPQSVKDSLKDVGLWDVNPLNLYRINWHNEPVERVDSSVASTSSKSQERLQEPRPTSMLLQESSSHVESTRLELHMHVWHQLLFQETSML